MERSIFNAKREDLDLASLVQIVFSWTFNDVRNENLCKHKVNFFLFYEIDSLECNFYMRMKNMICKKLYKIICEILHFPLSILKMKNT